MSSCWSKVYNSDLIYVSNCVMIITIKLTHIATSLVCPQDLFNLLTEFISFALTRAPGNHCPCSASISSRFLARGSFHKEPSCTGFWSPWLHLIAQEWQWPTIIILCSAHAPVVSLYHAYNVVKNLFGLASNYPLLVHPVSHETYLLSILVQSYTGWMNQWKAQSVE